MFESLLYFTGGVSVKQSNINNICEKVLKTIESELPEEARSHELYEFILSECKDLLSSKKVTL